MCLRVGFFFFFFFSQVSMAQYLSKKELPISIQKILDDLSVRRFGSGPKGFMVTHGFTGSISPDTVYRLTKKGLVLTKKQKDKIPRHIDLEARWLGKNSFNKDQANILGDSGKLILGVSSLLIPESKTTYKALSYYDCKLLKVGDKFTFGGLKDLPIADMSVGETYIEEYLLKAEHGGGAYLEYHDNPHFHMPKDKEARGFLILGKKVSKDLFRLSAFRIPYGYAVYTGPYVIHADSFLVGNYLVAYSTSHDYSTVILKDQKNQIVSVSIGELE